MVIDTSTRLGFWIEMMRCFYSKVRWSSNCFLNLSWISGFALLLALEQQRIQQYEDFISCIYVDTASSFQTSIFPLYTGQYVCQVTGKVVNKY